MGRVIFLGTGDPFNGERAQSSLAVLLSSEETMLIDASSGTVLLRQLEAAGIPPRAVQHLFVTHRHFDHAGGLAPLLTALAALSEASIIVHATSGTLEALRVLLDLTIPGVEGWLGERLLWTELEHGEPTTIGYARITPFEVNHSIECVGFRVEQEDSTMVHAADTRPCANVVEHARGADLLVLDAYGPENDAKRAHAYGHCTAAEAGGTAQVDGVRQLVITHLRASRFVDPEELKAEAVSVFGGPVDVARDLATFDF